MDTQIGRAKDLFLDALDLPSADDRRAFLDRACGGDTALRGEVEDLLAHHRGIGSFLATPAADPAATASLGATPVPAAAADPGEVIGPYRLLEPLGEGGFGLVYVAEQAHPVKRRVALKVLKPGMDTREVVARFEAERQALALMDHPHIARVFDGGATPAGRPYFVMELVKGVPVTQYCDDRRLPVRARLGLFADLCGAVQHAHQKGVIHRDLKPSNVLVAEHDGRPVVKVIDFGVAKAVGPSLTDKTVYTRAAQMVGTPLYMSPEQAGGSGLDVDTRSDVYSLGVVLYELLIGTTPFGGDRLRGLGYDEIRRVIREEEPARPSARLSTLGPAAPTVSAARGSEPRKLSKLVRGDLDWVVMKALEKDRARRYESAGAFAADIRRYLAGEPVAAAPPSRTYRLRKFARRNRAALAAAAAAVLVVVLAVAGLVANNRMVARERDEKQKALDAALAEKGRADRNLAGARKAVKDYLTKAAQNPLLKEADFHTLRRQLLESALPFYQEFVKQQSDDPALEAERGRAFGDLALLREDLGEADLALADHDRRRAIFERLADDHPDDPVYRQELANSWRNFGNAHLTANRPGDAEEAYRRARTLLEALAAEYPAHAPYRQDLAGADGNLAVLLRRQGRPAEALTLQERSLGVRERLAADFPDRPEYRRDAAQSHLNLGSVFHDLGRYDDALAALGRAEGLLRKLVDEFPADAEYREHLAGALSNKGYVLFDLTRFDDGLTASREGLRVEEALAADFPTLPGYRQSAAQSYGNLVFILIQLRRYEEAASAADQALEKLSRLVKEFPKTSAYRQDLALAHVNRGEALRKLGRSEDALAAFREALGIQERLAAESPGPRSRKDLGMTYTNVADLLVGLARYDEAAGAAEKAVAVRERLAADFSAVLSFGVELGAAYGVMGDLLRKRGQPEPSLAWYAKALAKLEPILAADPRMAPARQFAFTIYANRAMALDDLGRHAEALADWDRALALDGTNLPFRLKRAKTLAMLNRPPVGVEVAPPPRAKP
jgi:serine/threonine protein kinase